MGCSSLGELGKKLKNILYISDMSSFLTPTIFSKNGLENQWVNGIWNMHELFCGCNDTWKHLAAILSRQGNQLCLPSTTTDAATSTDPDVTEDVGLEPGDLDRLFEEDFDEGDG